jgi:hypothetical protein
MDRVKLLKRTGGDGVRHGDPNGAIEKKKVEERCNRS